MFKIIVMVLLGSLTHASDFKYNDRVLVVGGFYSGCAGTIKDRYNDNAYDVLFTDKCDRKFIKIPSDMLKLDK